jgi:striatin 1/3/4
LKEAEDLLAVTMSSKTFTSAIDDSQIKVNNNVASELLNKRSSSVLKPKGSNNLDRLVPERNSTIKKIGNLPGNFTIKNLPGHFTIKGTKEKRSIPVQPSGDDSVDISSTISSCSEDSDTTIDGTVPILSVTNQIESKLNLLWNSQPPLKNHYDSIRSVCFHPNDFSLFTGSEDSTVKLWRLSENSDSKLVTTFRGHTSPVTSISISPVDNVLFSASLDSSIRMWSLPPLDTQPFSPYHAPTLNQLMIGHSDAVWEIQAHSTAPFLISASADGTLKLWDTQSLALKSTFWYDGNNSQNQGHLESPTTVSWANINSIVAGFKNSSAKMFDIETKRTMVQFESNKSFGSHILMLDQSINTQITKLITHSTLPLCITAHEDGEIRIFDIHNGQLVHSVAGHVGGTSTIALSPDGTTLVSGGLLFLILGYDGIIKWWDLSTYSCIQETNAHKPKGSEGVWSLDFHKSIAGKMASGGADSNAIIFNKNVL